MNPTDEWRIMWYIHTMGNYSAIKGNKVVILATTHMNLINITLGERSQKQKTTYWEILFICNVQNK